MEGSRSGVARKSFSGNLRRPVVIGWVDSQKVFLEEIFPASVAVAPSIPMSATGDEDELESLLFLDQRIDQPISRFGWDVPVQFAHDQHQFSF